MGPINLHFSVTLVKSKINALRFMIKYYQINPELDIDYEFNKAMDEALSENFELKTSWSGTTQQEKVIDTIIDRWNFFIEKGKITCIEKQGITEIKFENGMLHAKMLNSHGGVISERKEMNKWDFGRYHILRYHLVQDLKDKLQNLDILDLDSLATEYHIDKGFLIDFIFSLVNKNNVEIDENKSLLKIKSNIDQVINQLDQSISEMELGLVA